MAVDSEAVARLMLTVKEKLHSNAEIMYQQAIAGPPEPDLIAANMVLVSQIQTLDSSQTSRIAYQTCRRARKISNRA